MNKKQRSISFNSVSPFNKKPPPLKRVPLSFGLNLEFQKKINNLQFYDSANDPNISVGNVVIQNKSLISGLNPINEERRLSSRMAKRKFTNNEAGLENLKTNITSATHSRVVLSKLSNYSQINSKPKINAPAHLIQAHPSVSDSQNYPQNISFISKISNPRVSRSRETIDIQRINSQDNPLRVKDYQLSQQLPKQSINRQSNSIGGGVNLPPKPIKKQNSRSIDQNQCLLLSEQPAQFNPLHVSFYHNTHLRKKTLTNVEQQLDFQNSHIIKNKKEFKQIKRLSFTDNSHQQYQYKSIQNLSHEQSISQDKRESQSHLISVDEQLQNNTIPLIENIQPKSSPQKRYKKLQDPDKILQYIDQKEIGFDTTEDIIQVLNIAQKNTNEQLINKKRQPLAPLPNKFQDKVRYKNTNIKYIQKSDLAFNQIDETELQSYIKEKEQVLNQIEINRYNDRYDLNRDRENVSAQRKSREKNYRMLDKMEDSFGNLNLSLSQLDIYKNESPVIPNRNNISPKMGISTKQSSFDQKFGAIMPIKKFYKDFDEYSVQQKNLLRTQEQSPMNNGYSGKLEKMKKQSDQLSKITYLLHQIQRDDPIL